MGKNYENKRRDVGEAREESDRIRSDQTVLKNEYSLLDTINDMLSDVDDEVAETVRDVSDVGEREDSRLNEEHDENEEEKRRIAGEIDDEIDKLRSGMSTLESMRDNPFGKKSVEQARKDYQEQSQKYEQLLNELGEESDVGIGKSGSGGGSIDSIPSDNARLENTNESTETQPEVGGVISDWISDTFSNSSNYDSIVNHLTKSNVAYRPLQIAHGNRTTEDIVNKLGGGDLTQGSCSSLALAYAGNIAGYEVLDFRDGASRDYFSSRSSIEKIASLPNVRSVTLNGTDDIASANQLLKDMTPGKEYYLATGQHAAIVRNTGNGYEYLELQHPSTGNGWHELDDYILTARFGASRNHSVSYSNYMIDVESLSNSQEFINILGYINTAESAQVKGVSGNVR